MNHVITTMCVCLRGVLVALVAVFGAGSVVAGARIGASWEVERQTVYRHEHIPLTLCLTYPESVRPGQLRISGLLDAEGLVMTRFEPLLPHGRGTDDAGQRVVEKRYRAWGSAPHAGTVRLEPHLDYIVIEREVYDYFMSREIEIPGSTSPGALALEVLELPETGRPAGFRNAVGSFEMTTVLTNDAPATPGALLSLLTDITGSGNFVNVSAPQPVFKAGESWRVYDAREVARSGNSVVFERTIVPLDSGRKVFPALTFSYFDPVKETYVVLTNGPFAVYIDEPSMEDAGLSGATERSVDDPARLWRLDQRIDRRYRLLLLLAAAAGAMAWLGRRRRRSRAGNHA